MRIARVSGQSLMTVISGTHGTALGPLAGVSEGGSILQTVAIALVRPWVSPRSTAICKSFACSSAALCARSAATTFFRSASSFAAVSSSCRDSLRQY